MMSLKIRRKARELKMWFGQQEVNINTSIFYVDSDYESLSVNNTKVCSLLLLIILIYRD